jgi:hypothetical protein
MSERTSSERGGAPPRTPPNANAKPSELERARIRRLLEGPLRPARASSHEQARSDVVLSELRAVRNDVACLQSSWRRPSVFFKRAPAFKVTC